MAFKHFLMTAKIAKVAAAALLLAVLVGLMFAFKRTAIQPIEPIPPAQASPLESYTGFALKFSLMAGLGDRNTVVPPLVSTRLY